MRHRVTLQNSARRLSHKHIHTHTHTHMHTHKQDTLDPLELGPKTHSLN